MKSLFSILIIATGFYFSPFAVSLIWAQSSSNTQIEALEDMVAWNQASTQIQTDLMSLFDAETMQEMYSVLNEGNLDEIARFGQRFMTEQQLVLARAERQMNALPKPEKWNIDPRLFSRKETATYRAALGQYNSMKETYEEFSKMSGGMAEMLTNIESLDDEALIKLQKIQVRSSIRIIEIENRQIDGYLIAIPATNPNHQFQKIVKQLNLATIPEIEWSADPSGDISVRQDYGRKMRDALLPIAPMIREGRRNMKRQIEQLKAVDPDSTSTADRQLLPKVVKLYETFGDTFDIEEKLLAASKSSARLYMSDESDDAISSRVDENDIAFFFLLEERAKLFDQRLSVLE